MANGKNLQRKTMKLLKYQGWELQNNCDLERLRRIDLVNPITGELPTGIPSGDMAEVVAAIQYNHTYTLKVTGAITTQEGISTLEHDGKSYTVTGFSDRKTYEDCYHFPVITGVLQPLM
jgi:hypothetical protein